LDHILFIIALLLPSVLVLREGSYQPAESFQESFWYVARVATLFTVAHSVTLSLSSLNIFRLPSAPVEAMIALSIAVTAWGNIRPYLEGRGVWVMIFGFGLFHGFGFASVLAPLGLDASSLLAGLLGFNIGVELGQLAIIAAVFPVLFVLRRTPIYIPIVLRLGSALLIAMALFWFVERMGEVVYLLQDKGYL
ncbi:MAG: HupE/UreJ family protein, partial [Myxococcota bacterium]